jgi:hypothetical protein
MNNDDSVLHQFEDINVSLLLTYLQFRVIKWAKQRPGQSPFDVKSDEAIQI